MILRTFMPHKVNMPPPYYDAME